MRTFTGAHCFFQIFTTMNSIFFCEIWHAHVKMRKKWSLILIGFFFTRAMESTQTFYTLNKVNLANFYNICFFHRQNPKILRNLIFSLHHSMGWSARGNPTLYLHTPESYMRMHCAEAKLEPAEFFKWKIQC